MQKNKGYTLVETLVSLGLLLTFFSSLAAIFTIVTNLIGESRTRSVATGLAAEKLEVIHNLSYNDIGTQGGIPDGVLNQAEIVNVNGLDFNVNTTILYIDDVFDDQAPVDPISTDYKRIRVSVSWGGAFPSGTPVTMTTDIVPDGLETNEGGGTLIINVINSSGIPISNAQVAITNTDVDPAIDLNISANNDGQVVLPGAPICSDCYNIEVTKSGYSLDKTYTSAEVANPLKPQATVLEGEVTSLTFSIDQTVTLHVETKGSRSSNFPPFSGVQFIMQGENIIGTDVSDQPVYKYTETLSSGPGGRLTLSNIEPDVYHIWIPEGASVDFAGSSPITPFKILPGTDRTLLIATEPATSNNLLVMVQDLNEKAIATASAMIQGPGSFEASGSAGIQGAPDNGQILFSNIPSGNYQVFTSQQGYLDASESATVSNDSKVYILMENE